MDYKNIRQCLADCRFTDHARQEMETEPFAERKLVIITVYQPDPARWDPELRRRRTP